MVTFRLRNICRILIRMCPFREQREQQKSQDGPAPSSRSRTSESGSNARHTPPVPTDEVTPAPSGKPNWAEEGGSSWGGQTSAGPYQVRPACDPLSRHWHTTRIYCFGNNQHVTSHYDDRNKHWRAHEVLPGWLTARSFCLYAGA